MLSAQPIPGADMAPPVTPPGPGEVIIGYETFQNTCGCSGMTKDAQFCTVVLVLLFWPVAWIPCVMKSSFKLQQRPVYGPPGSVPVDDNEVVVKNGAKSNTWNVTATDGGKFVRV